MPSKNSACRPPSRLSAEARAFYRDIVAEFGIEDVGGLALVARAAESLDRMRSAETAIRKDGETFKDRFGQLKPHPLLTVERDARAAFIAAVKALNLDIEPLRDRLGRPPGGRA